jgi:GT2 family glycosyltransferase
MDAEQWKAHQRNLRASLRGRRDRRTGGGGVEFDAGAPRASVIVVCWNAGKVLGRCLDQLLAQDYADYEIIVVDDGSRDNTLEIAHTASSRGALRIVRSHRNWGCPHARNLGIARAEGEIVAFIDADGFAAPNWLTEVVAAFSGDETIGAVASTVFFDGNPVVINGAGGTVNRQGWAADLTMSESYEWAEIASEALYPMGCGMALRRSVIERVGPFDDRMLNYYDDVDYGVRVWRAGYRVAVAPDAWIDHGFGRAGGDSARTPLLCERHRMRVVLKHASARTLAPWVAHEARAFAGSARPRRAQKLRAAGWNLRHLPSVLASRRRMRRMPGVPSPLVDDSWGDGFPAGLPSLSMPRPEIAARRIDMASPDSGPQLLYGWFPTERVDGRSYRWAGVQAGALVRLQAPARRLSLDYAHVPGDIGEVELSLRPIASADPLVPAWSTKLRWQYISRSIENHPLSLPAGDYEVLFSAREGWLEPPLRTRSISLALASLSFEESYEVEPGGLDMAAAAVEEQLVSGWFEAEQSPERSYRWAGAHAGAVIRLEENASFARLSYRPPPRSTGGLTLTARRLGDTRKTWATRLLWRDADWHEESLPLELPAGDYLMSFDADSTWSNPDGADAGLWRENRALGFALSRMSFDSVR